MSSSTPIIKRNKIWTRRKDARPGITKGAISRCYPSKEEVFKSPAPESVAAPLKPIMQEADRFQGSFRECMTSLFNVATGTVQTSESALLPKIILAGSGDFPELALSRRKVAGKVPSALSGVVAKAIARGEHATCRRIMLHVSLAMQKGPL